MIVAGLARIFGAKWTTGGHPRDPALASLFGGSNTVAGETVDQNTALGLSAVWRATQIICGVFESIPCFVIDKVNENTTRMATENPAWRMLHDDANPEMSASTAMATIQQYALNWGNGVAEIERTRRGVPVYWWPIPPWRVNITRTRSDSRLVYEIAPETSGPNVTLEMRDVIHHHGLSLDGVFGYSIIAAAREALGLGIAVQKFGAAFFGNGANFNGVLERPKDAPRMNEDTIRRIKASLEAYRGAGNQQKTLILEEGMTYNKIGIAPDDAQFLQTREHVVEDVSRWYGVPPHLLSDLRRATYSNIEHQGIEAVTYCYLPWGRRLENEFRRKLFEPGSTLSARFQFAGLMRADTPSRYAAYGQGIKDGWLKRNESRKWEDLDRDEAALDRYLQPLNMQVVGDPLPGQGEKADPVADDLAFKREVVKSLIADGTIGDVIFNLTDGKALLKQVNIPIEPTAANSDNAEPWLPVVASPGPLVSGEVIKDGEGDIVGGDIEEPEPVPADGLEQQADPGSGGLGTGDNDAGEAGAAPVDPPKSGEADAETVAALIDAHSTAVIAALDRMHKRFSKDMERASGKGAATFEKWKREYADKNRDIFMENILPPVQAFSDTLRIVTGIDRAPQDIAALVATAVDTALDTWVRGGEYVVDMAAGEILTRATRRAGATDGILQNH